VLDNPSMPIVGENGEEENDRFVEQLVANAEAAVSELVRRGVSGMYMYTHSIYTAYTQHIYSPLTCAMHDADERVAVGGHSYGAFMATNLLAHSRLFQAGIGRSGAYNRLLTPFGFQSEERTLWEAPEVLSVSVSVQASWSASVGVPWRRCTCGCARDVRGVQQAVLVSPARNWASLCTPNHVPSAALTTQCPPGVHEDESFRPSRQD
jgi:hypothetical protein